MSKRLRKRREVPLHKLECNMVYRITGAWHIRVNGRLFGAGGVVAGQYQGQIQVNGTTRLLFRDNDGTEYVVTPPEHTFGLVAARVFALREV